MKTKIKNAGTKNKNVKCGARDFLNFARDVN